MFLVDDDGVTRMLIRAALEDVGHSVEEFERAVGRLVKEFRAKHEKRWKEAQS